MEDACSGLSEDRLRVVSRGPFVWIVPPFLPKVAEESSTLAQDSCLGALSTFFENVTEEFMLEKSAKWESIVPEICTALILSTMGTGEKTHERGEAVCLRYAKLAAVRPQSKLSSPE